MNNIDMSKPITSMTLPEYFKRCNKLVITGGVGVGKTTTINILCSMLKSNNIKYVKIPEFIDGDVNGQQMLNDFLTGVIDVFTFQYYVLLYYDRYLSNLVIDDTDTLLIFERLPDDSVTCFSNRANKEGKITNEQLFNLYKYSMEINDKYNLPTYFNKICNEHNIQHSYIHLLIKTDDKNKVANQIYDEVTSSKALKHKTNLFIIGLYNTPEECYKRINKRGIQCEIDAYTIKTVEEFNKHYTNLYMLFMSGKTLRYCEMGNLIA